jgi:hypothetical protein
MNCKELNCEFLAPTLEDDFRTFCFGPDLLSPQSSLKSEVAAGESILYLVGGAQLNVRIADIPGITSFLDIKAFSMSRSLKSRCVFDFSFMGFLLLLLSLSVTHVVLHGVSIRTLGELG